MSQAEENHRPKGRRMEVGERYGRLVAVRFAERKIRTNFWLFRCDCGNETKVRVCSVRSGDTTSCGCFQREAAAARLRTHGMRDAQEYYIWGLMIKRCTDPKDRGYPRYGGRGITVCERWRGSFEAFYADLGPRPSPEHSLDRKNNDKGYEPGNVRWATREEQARNKRNNRIVVLDGRSMTLVEAAERAGRDYQLVHSRLQHGWTLERALSQPSRGNWRGVRT